MALETCAYCDTSTSSVTKANGADRLQMQYVQSSSSLSRYSARSKLGICVETQQEADRDWQWHRKSRDPRRWATTYVPLDVGH
jgi:hypothetical protein